MSKDDSVLHRRSSRKISVISITKFPLPEDLKIKSDGPIDTLSLTKVTCFMLGIGCMLTTNFFVTANEYWMYKFRNATLETTDSNNRTLLQANFASTFTLVTSVPNVIVAFLCTFFGHHVKSTVKIYSFLWTTVALFSMHAIFVEIDTDSWQLGFFLLTMATGVVISSVSSMGNVGMYSVVGRFPHIYMHYFLLGQGTADIFSAALRIFTLAAVSSFKASAVMYFLTGAGLFFFTTILYFVAAKRKHFRYYANSNPDEETKTMKSINEVFSVFKDVWLIILLVVLGILVPVHTAVTSLVVSEYAGTGSAWGETYFVPVVTYLVSAIASVLGRAIAAAFSNIVTLKSITILSIIRSTVLPALLYLCNAKPRHNLPVVFTHDWEYGILLATYMLVTGFLQNSTMLLIIKYTTVEKRDTGFTLILLSLFLALACMSFVGVAAVNLL